MRNLRPDLIIYKAQPVTGLPERHFAGLILSASPSAVSATRAATDCCAAAAFRRAPRRSQPDHRHRTRRVPPGSVLTDARRSAPRLAGVSEYFQSSAKRGPSSRFGPSPGGLPRRRRALCDFVELLRAARLADQRRPSIWSFSLPAFPGPMSLAADKRGYFGSPSVQATQSSLVNWSRMLTLRRSLMVRR